MMFGLSPSLLRYEMRHVLLEHVRAKPANLAQAEQVLETAFAVVGSIDDSASDLALAIAIELQISSYDAEYIALAQSMSMPVVTFDQKLIRAARGFPFPLTSLLLEPNRGKGRKRSPRSRAAR